MQTVSVAGFGRVGGALALALHGRGYKILSVTGTSREKADRVLSLIEPRPEFRGAGQFRHAGSDVILLTVRDDQLADAAAELAAEPDIAGAVVLHTSGSKGSDVLALLREKGAETGSLHPLVSVSDPVSGSTAFDGVYFCVEGTDRAVGSATKIATDLGGKPFQIPTDKKPLYHAAAVMACGHLVALVDEAVEALSACGPEPPEAAQILLPLISSTVANLSRQSTSEALTGTFARGDVETFRAHVSLLRREVPPEVLEAYLLLGERSLSIARRAGLDDKKAAELLDALTEETGRTG